MGVIVGGTGVSVGGTGVSVASGAGVTVGVTVDVGVEVGQVPKNTQGFILILSKGPA